MHLASSIAMSAAALSDRNARHTSIALLLAPSRYANWALQVREAILAARFHAQQLHSPVVITQNFARGVEQWLNGRDYLQNRMR